MFEKQSSTCFCMTGLSRGDLKVPQPGSSLSGKTKESPVKKATSVDLPTRLLPTTTHLGSSNGFVSYIGDGARVYQTYLRILGSCGISVEEEAILYGVA